MSYLRPSIHQWHHKDGIGLNAKDIYMGDVDSAYVSAVGHTRHIATRYVSPCPFILFAEMRTVAF